MHYNYDSKLIWCAKQLRKNPTPQERKLWYEYLRDYPVHIYRQRVMGRYIVDFYCPEACLVVELDGSQHDEGDGPEKDRVRTAFLEEQGLTVLRFFNSEINDNFDGVCTGIDTFVRSAMGDRFPERS